jgi:hypothetical protein
MGIKGGRLILSVEGIAERGSPLRAHFHAPAAGEAGGVHEVTTPQIGAGWGRRLLSKLLQIHGTPDPVKCSMASVRRWAWLPRAPRPR